MRSVLKVARILFASTLAGVFLGVVGGAMHMQCVGGISIPMDDVVATLIPLLLLLSVALMLVGAVRALNARAKNVSTVEHVQARTRYGMIGVCVFAGTFGAWGAWAEFAILGDVEHSCPSMSVATCSRLAWLKGLREETLTKHLCNLPNPHILTLKHESMMMVDKRMILFSMEYGEPKDCSSGCFHADASGVYYDNALYLYDDDLFMQNGDLDTLPAVFSSLDAYVFIRSVDKEFSYLRRINDAYSQSLFNDPNLSGDLISKIFATVEREGALSGKCSDAVLKIAYHQNTPVTVLREIASLPEGVYSQYKENCDSAKAMAQQRLR